MSSAASMEDFQNTDLFKSLRLPKISRTQLEPLEKWNDVEYFKSIGVPIISPDEAEARAGNLSTSNFEK